jgi:hypothetical protein
MQKKKRKIRDNPCESVVPIKAENSTTDFTDRHRFRKRKEKIRVNPCNPWFQSKQRIQPRISRIDTDSEKEEKKSVGIRVNPCESVVPIKAENSTTDFTDRHGCRKRIKKSV